MRAPVRICLTVALLVMSRGPATAQAKPDAPPAERFSETRHTVTINGQKVDYVATAGQILLKEDDGKPIAAVFFVSYHKTKVTEPPPPMPGQPPAPVTVAPADPSRPITFCFNGGPGSSSVWLHLGAFGPRRVLFPESGEAPSHPAKLGENDLSLLDLTDLVFLDPVTTGFSRAVPGVDPKRFHGTQEDATAVGEFVRLFLSRYNRWSSPKYLAGESYGTTRAAALAEHLQSRHGIDLNGVVLVSSILNFLTARFDDGNDLPYALFLPTYTATAWYHKKLPAELQADFRKALTESEQFAGGDYMRMLMKGGNLSGEERTQLAEKLARLTGLSQDFITRSRYRVDIGRFTKELLREQGKTVGRFDSRLKGDDADDAGERFEYDPSYAAIQGAYTTAMNVYLRRDLKFETDQGYEILTGKVQPWDFGAKNRYLNVTPALRAALTKNRDLKVFVASGFYDLATPYFATDYTVSHLGGDPELLQRVTTAYYEAGHMMYAHRPSHEKLRKDLVQFYAPPPPPVKP